MGLNFRVRSSPLRGQPRHDTWRCSVPTQSKITHIFQGGENLRESDSRVLGGGGVSGVVVVGRGVGLRQFYSRVKLAWGVLFVCYTGMGTKRPRVAQL